jgi:hypothetical protein
MTWPVWAVSFSSSSAGFGTDAGLTQSRGADVLSLGVGAPLIPDEETCCDHPRLKDVGIEVVVSGVRMPRMNSIIEGWVQTCRRELLDRTLIWNQHHLLYALRECETSKTPTGLTRASRTSARCTPCRSRLSVTCTDEVFGKGTAAGPTSIMCSRRCLCLGGSEGFPLSARAGRVGPCRAALKTYRKFSRGCQVRR